MLSSGLLPLLLLLTAVELSWALNEDDKRLIVELHNTYRSQVSPPAADMLKMSWDPELEVFAKAYAAKCIWGHNKARGRRGENLFAITDEMDVEIAMDQWYSEQEHYNLSTAKCAVGQMCGHYTQVVWANSKYIGCGMQFCKTLHGVEEPDLFLLVCNYDPPGNVRGRKPYKEGPACSQCPEGYTCRNSICEPKGEPEEASTSSRTTRPAPTMTTTTSLPTTTATSPAPTMTTSPPTTTATRLAPTTTMSPPTTTATRLAPTTVEKKPAPPASPTPIPSTPHSTTSSTTRLNPTTTTSPAPASTTVYKRPTPTTSSLTPTLKASPNSPSDIGPTPSLEPTSDLELTSSPEKQVGSEETGAPLGTTEEVLFFNQEPTFGPPTSPERQGAWKEPNAVALGAEPALTSEFPPSFSLTPPETELSLDDTKQPPHALQPAPATAKVTSLLHVLPSSKATGRHNLAVHASLSGAREVEELMMGLSQNNLDQLSGSASSNFLEFSIFLLAAAILTGLLL